MSRFIHSFLVLAKQLQTSQVFRYKGCSWHWVSFSYSYRNPNPNPIPNSNPNPSDPCSTAPSIVVSRPPGKTPFFPFHRFSLQISSWTVAWVSLAQLRESGLTQTHPMKWIMLFCNLKPWILPSISIVTRRFLCSFHANQTHKRQRYEISSRVSSFVFKFHSPIHICYSSFVFELVDSVHIILIRLRCWMHGLSRETSAIFTRWYLFLLLLRGGRRA